MYTGKRMAAAYHASSMEQPGQWLLTAASKARHGASGSSATRIWLAHGSSGLSGVPLGFPPQRCACSCIAVGEEGRKVGSQVKPGAEPPRLCKAPSPLPSTDACACRCTVERGIEGNEEPSQSPQEADPSSSQ